MVLIRPWGAFWQVFEMHSCNPPALLETATMAEAKAELLRAAACPPRRAQVLAVCCWQICGDVTMLLQHCL